MIRSDSLSKGAESKGSAQNRLAKEWHRIEINGHA